MTIRGLSIFLAAAVLGGCLQQGTIEGTRAEHMSIGGRKLKVNVGPTGTPDEWRLLVVRETMVINPDTELETERAQEAARRVMESTCKGKPSRVVSEGLSQQINYYVLFRCAA